MAVLSLVIVLLVAASLIVFFANRTLVFEQRSSANQMHAARALAAAESGLEWALASLNDPRRIDARCVPDADAAESFRERHAPASASGGFTPASLARPGCRLGESSMVCACPAAGEGAALMTGAGTAFSVEFNAVPGEPEALQITVRGCTAASRECEPGSAAGLADGVAVVQTMVKLVPPWAAMPVAALTVAGSIDLDSSTTVVNTDASTQGLLVHAGGSLTGTALEAPDERLRTVPGSPLAPALLVADAALAAEAAGGAETFFARRFGLTPAQFRNHPAVRVIGGCAAAECAARIAAAAAEGYTAFHVDGDLLLDAFGVPGAIGSESRPFLIVVTGRVMAGTAAPRHGLIHLTGASDADGLHLQGALVSQTGLRLGWGARVHYAPEVLHRLRLQAGQFVRVPGTWRDGRCIADDAAQPCALAP